MMSQRATPAILQPRQRVRYLKLIAIFKIAKGLLLLALGCSLLFLNARDGWMDRISEWADVDRDGRSGTAVLDAVDRGRLWVNILTAERLDARFAAVRDEIQAALRREAPHLDVRSVTVGVLVSSPRAMVYFHADAEPNLVCHISGNKRIWIYPALDFDLVDPMDLAAVFAGGDEELPYDPAYDRAASAIDLMPGTFVSWPQNAPHRVVNGDDVNITVTVSYSTPAADRRIAIWTANRWWHETLRLPMRHELDRGVVVAAKVAIFRLLRKLGIADRTQRRERRYAYRLDPEAPDGRA